MIHSQLFEDFTKEMEDSRKRLQQKMSSNGKPQTENSEGVDLTVAYELFNYHTEMASTCRTKIRDLVRNMPPKGTELTEEHRSYLMKNYKTLGELVEKHMNAHLLPEIKVGQRYSDVEFGDTVATVTHIGKTKVRTSFVRFGHPMANREIDKMELRDKSKWLLIEKPETKYWTEIEAPTFTTGYVIPSRQYKTTCYVDIDESGELDLVIIDFSDGKQKTLSLKKR